MSVDGFHHPRAVRYARAEASPAESYYEDSFDYAAFRTLVVDPIRGDGERLITLHVFDHASDSPTDRVQAAVGPSALVLVDGIFLGRSELAAAWDCWIYLDAVPAAARARGAARDQRLYGDETDARYLNRYEPGQALYRAEADPLGNADIVIDNTTPEEPVVIRGLQAS